MRTVVLLRDRALRHEEAGRMDKAIRVYRRLSAHAARSLPAGDPLLLDCRDRLGRGYLRAGRLAEAARVFERTISETPADPAARLGLAAVRAAQGRGEEAADLAEEAFAELETPGLGAMLVRVEAHRAAGDLDRALNLAELALSEQRARAGETDSGTWTARAALARVRLARKEAGRAARELAPVWSSWQRDRRLRTHPDALSCGNDLAEIYLALGRDADADALLRRVLSLAGRRYSVGHPEIVRARESLSRISPQ
ncbi:tetratricopeptide repeat protein [Actinocorallia longicatena]|uniref:Tetratricopeptide repeat protein n=1 Tax=Actinocorallia longicatena TaxID=111803 RepID=A0ABP6QJ26_9ACTN